MRSMTRSAWFGLLVLISLGGCASMPMDEVRLDFLNGHPRAAMAVLDEPKNQSSRDALLTLMEKGLIYHHLGEYEQSTEQFLKAEKLMDKLNYVSLSEQATTLVTNEWMAAYRGEYSERLWVHTYQMMNYLLLGQYENAAVEARQALKLYDSFSEPLKLDRFTRALIALSFESVGKMNDALIEYKKLAKALPDKRAIAWELYRTARLSGLPEEAEQYRQLLPEPLRDVDPDEEGELVVFVATGAIPQKVAGDIFYPPDIRISFPHYLDTHVPPPHFRIESEGAALPVTTVSTILGDVARRSLDARGKKVFAKEAARVAAKNALKRDLRKNNETAGAVLGLLFFALEEADTRGWSTLPATLSLLRIPLKPGTHDISILSDDGSRLPQQVFGLEHLEIEAGQRIYRKIRY